MLDLSPILADMLNLLAVAITTAATYGVWLASRWIKQRAGIELDDVHRANINTAIENGIFWATARVNELLEPGASEIAIKNEMAHQMAEYVTARVPDALKNFGIDEAGTRQLVLSRLEAIWGESDITAPDDPGL